MASEADQGIHGERPISWQLDRAIEKAAATGRPIAHISAAEPFVKNLLAELANEAADTGDPRATRYLGILIETNRSAETGWAAYDRDGKFIDRYGEDG